jgi:hypothetical protein
MTSQQTFIRFEHGQDDRMSEVFGPFEFVQLTYGSLRVGPDGDIFFATHANGLWITEDGEAWSDVVIWGDKVESKS